jgi:TRAP-type mannitol/chloroaromatic compound transport system permease small subunit
MQALLKLARFIDALNERIGRSVYWLVLVAVLVSAGNAIVRKVFNMSSNAFLEAQWYLFSAVFLFCSGFTCSGTSTCASTCLPVACPRAGKR